MERLHRFLICFFVVGIVFTWFPNVISFGFRYFKYHYLLALLILWFLRKGLPRLGIIDLWIILGLAIEILLVTFRQSIEFLRLGELLLIYLGLTIFFDQKKQINYFLKLYSNLSQIIVIFCLLAVPTVLAGFTYDIPSTFGYEYLKEVRSEYETFLKADHLRITPLGIIFNTESRMFGFTEFDYRLCGFSYEPHVAMFLVCPGCLYAIETSKGHRRKLVIIGLGIFSFLAGSITGFIALGCATIYRYGWRFGVVAKIGAGALAFIWLAPTLIESMLQLFSYKFGSVSTSKDASLGSFRYIFYLQSVLGGGSFTLPRISSDSGGLFALVFYLGFIVIILGRILQVRETRYGLFMAYVLIHFLKFPIQAFNYPLFLTFMIILERATRNHSKERVVRKGIT